jgi:hypothetical protein
MTKVRHIPLIRKVRRLNIYYLLARLFFAVNEFLFGKWTWEDAAHFQQTRKEFFDEYTVEELRAMEQEEAQRRAREEEAARFWSGL